MKVGWKIFLFLKPTTRWKNGFPIFVQSEEMLKEENIKYLFPFVHDFTIDSDEYIHHLVTLGNPKGPFLFASYNFRSKEFVDARLVDLKGRDLLLGKKGDIVSTIEKESKIFKLPWIKEK
jgi:hypothetical protein